MTEKRFRYDWKTGGFKDTLSNSCATTNMRVLETQINDACFNYEKKIKKLEKEKEELQFYLELNKTNYNYVIEQLEEEIKQLKEEVKEYKEAMKRMMIDMMRG